jgi:hypothetical protein
VLNVTLAPCRSAITHDDGKPTATDFWQCWRGRAVKHGPGRRLGCRGRCPQHSTCSGWLMNGHIHLAPGGLYLTALSSRLRNSV